LSLRSGSKERLHPRTSWMIRPSTSVRREVAALEAIGPGMVDAENVQAGASMSWTLTSPSKTGTPQLVGRPMRGPRPEAATGHEGILENGWCSRPMWGNAAVRHSRNGVCPNSSLQDHQGVVEKPSTLEVFDERGHSPVHRRTVADQIRADCPPRGTTRPCAPDRSRKLDRGGPRPDDISPVDQIRRTKSTNRPRCSQAGRNRVYNPPQR
jgi:hypothetical protein